MASMILEYQTKTDSHRIAESVKWFEDIEDRYEINKTKYIYLEVILRQLFIHEKMNTAFFYENEKQIHLTKNITELRGEIDYYLKKVDPSKNYGCHRLDFEKKERIKSASDAPLNILSWKGMASAKKIPFKGYSTSQPLEDEIPTAMTNLFLFDS
jgi:hypothetical protein